MLLAHNSTFMSEIDKWDIYYQKDLCKNKTAVNQINSTKIIWIDNSYDTAFNYVIIFPQKPVVSSKKDLLRIKIVL